MLALFALADFLNSFGGGKFLFSSKSTSIALSAMLHPPLQKFPTGVKNDRILCEP
jgi:hypothetical protein